MGLRIVAKAGQTGPGQKSVKRAVVEMGGKNAILIDVDADLDQAIPAVMSSAFGYQGQKCSACSRVIIHAGCYDRFLARLCEAVNGLTVGSPEDPANGIGPVIDAAAKERVQATIENPKKSLPCDSLGVHDVTVGCVPRMTVRHCDARHNRPSPHVPPRLDRICFQEG